MRKFLFILVFATLLFGFWQSVKAVDVLIDYPAIKGAQSPNETSDLPQLINYIYKFALLACGIVAFISILIGAIRYVTSAGDASKAGDAKEQIYQALLGVLILLAAVLILRIINPDLVNLNLSLPTSPNTTNPNATTECRCQDKDNPSNYFKIGCYNFSTRTECVKTCEQECKKLGPSFYLQCRENSSNCK